METLILGAGAVGLATAITLQRAGIATRVVARDLPPRTTSDVAAAFWQPYKADPRELIRDFGQTAFREFARLAKDDPGSGVTPRDCTVVFPEHAEEAWYHDLVLDYRTLAPEQLPAGFSAGYAFRTFVIETPRYMPWLLNTYQALGGRIERRELASIDQALADHDLVVNCTGLGARALLPDPALYPARGQLVRVPQFGLDRIWIGDDSPERLAYLVPRATDVICGGTFEEGEEDLTPNEETARAIRRRCARPDPRVAGAPVLEHLVGLRPCRPKIRLESESRAGGKTVIHNYGHGGCGITLSWGCARHVLNFARQALLP